MSEDPKAVEGEENPEPTGPTFTLLDAEPPSDPTPPDPAPTPTATPPEDPKPPAEPEPTNYESRPEWLPEKFWDVDKKEIRTDAAMKSYTDTQKELHRYQNGRGPGVPKEAAGYLTSEAVVDGNWTFGDEHPDLPPLPTDDPLLAAFSQGCFERGISQEDHDALIQKVYPAMAEIAKPTFDIEEEFVTLGDGDLNDGVRRRDAITTWIETLGTRGQLNETEVEALQGFASSAVHFKTLIKLRNMTGEKQIPLGVPEQIEGVPTKAELAAMVADERYTKDAAYRAEVTEAFKRAEPPDPKTEGPQFTA